MGYPMTFQRVVNRNDVRGDYGTKLLTVTTNFDADPDDFQAGVDFTHVLRKHIQFLEREIDRANGRWGSLSGDLRRLERDAVDENEMGVAGHIARRTGIDREVVGVVLKEFVAW